MKKWKIPWPGQWTKKRKLFHHSLLYSGKDFIVSAALFFLTVLLCLLLRSVDPHSDTSYVAILFFLDVFLTALLTDGYLFSILIAVTGVLCVDYVFTEPYWEISFTLAGFPLTFIVMMFISVVTGMLTSRAKQVESLKREAERERIHSNLLRAVSHDIRTPLALILGWGEQLQQDEALPAVARQKAAGICTQSEKIRSLIGDLNLTSKLQYGAQPLRRKAVTVGPFLRRCAAEFYESPAAGDSTLELELTQAAEHTVVQADEALLLRAIENLLHNAVGHNAVPVHVTIRADAADGMLTIQVTDDGQGYPPAVLAVLQAGETGENPPHILGLHVVEQILAAHGGTAAFAQALPHGAAAALTLPL